MTVAGALQCFVLVVLGLPSPLYSLSPPPPVRILCFGDSLTAGSIDMDGSGGLFPYATHLQAALEEAQPKRTFQVGHLGMPGWTASQMVQTADDPTYGLRHKLKQVNNPPVSLVVILAGTNDLGYSYQEGIEDGASAILGSLQALHRIAHEQNVPSMAVGIPTSRFQQQVSPALDLRLRVNQRLQEWAESTATMPNTPFTSYAPFPRAVPDPQSSPEADELWSLDGLHLTAKGYMAMGRELAGAVEKGLPDLHHQVHSRDL